MKNCSHSEWFMNFIQFLLLNEVDEILWIVKLFSFSELKYIKMFFT